MVAANDFSNDVVCSKASLFEELNFKKFFTSFLMRHLVLTKDKPRHIHDLDHSIPETAPMTETQTKHGHKTRKIWSTRNEIAYSFLMEACNAHSKSDTKAALYEGKTAKGLLRALEKNIVQAEVTKFNSMKVISNQSGAEFVDSVDAQAKILENLG